VSYEVLVTLNEPVACANFSIEFLELSNFESTYEIDLSDDLS